MTDHATGYREGHAAGYAKGRDDGIAIGYSDAKLRAWLALDAIETGGGIPRTHVAAVRDAFALTLGKRS